jgi:hypothetical protein
MAGIISYLLAAKDPDTVSGDMYRPGFCQARSTDDDLYGETYLAIALAKPMADGMVQIQYAFTRGETANVDIPQIQNGALVHKDNIDYDIDWTTRKLTHNEVLYILHNGGQVIAPIPTVHKGYLYGFLGKSLQDGKEVIRYNWAFLDTPNKTGDGVPMERQLELLAYPGRTETAEEIAFFERSYVPDNAGHEATGYEGLDVDGYIEKHIDNWRLCFIKPLTYAVLTMPLCGA